MKNTQTHNHAYEARIAKGQARMQTATASQKTLGIWDEKSKMWIRPSGTVKQGRRPMFQRYPENKDDTCPKCGSSTCTHAWELDWPDTTKIEAHAEALAEALRDISKTAQTFFDASKRESYKAIAYKAAQALANWEGAK